MQATRARHRRATRWVNAVCGGAALAWMAACSAHAAVTSSAVVTVTGYSLLDLDPTDGVAPSISFLPGATVVKGVRVLTSAVSYDAAYQSTPGTANAFVETPVDDRFGAGIAQGEVSTASSRATLRFDGVVGAQASAEGQTTGYNPAGIDVSSPLAQGFAMYSASAGLNLNFSLSARTSVIFTFSGATSVPVSGLGVDGAQGTVTFVASLGDSRGTGHVIPGETFTQSLAVFNLGRADEVGNLVLFASANGILSTPAPAVPEPDALALAVAGAALTGVVVRRRTGLRHRRGDHTRVGGAA